MRCVPPALTFMIAREKRGLPTIAALCTTASTSSGSPRIGVGSARSRDTSRGPRSPRRTAPTTVWPSSVSRRSIAAPTNPRVPVTSTFIGRSPR